MDGVRQGKRILDANRFDAIWSTYPIATAHAIGYRLSRHAKLPWVADMRDSMSEPGYPADPAVFRSVRELEGKVIRTADAVTFTAPGAIAMYAERYPDTSADKYRLLENGFDESSFSGIEAAHDADAAGPVTLLHSGIVYPSERDPRPFFDAVAALKSEGLADASRLRIVLRATGHDDEFRAEIEARGIADIVELEPGVAYREALREMLEVDGLIIFQASSCNHQIPAKVYEYFRAGRPIIALTDRQGDTAALLRRNGHELIADLGSADEIKSALQTAMDTFRRHPGANPETVAQRYSRRAQTGELAALLDELAGE